MRCYFIRTQFLGLGNYYAIQMQAFPLAIPRQKNTSKLFSKNIASVSASFHIFLPAAACMNHFFFLSACHQHSFSFSVFLRITLIRNEQTSFSTEFCQSDAARAHFFFLFVKMNSSTFGCIVRNVCSYIFHRKN